MGIGFLFSLSLLFLPPSELPLARCVCGGGEGGSPTCGFPPQKTPKSVGRQDPQECGSPEWVMYLVVGKQRALHHLSKGVCVKVGRQGGTETKKKKKRLRTPGA